MAEENGGVQRDLGRLEAQVGGLVSQVNDLNFKVGSIDKTLSEAKGGWKILLLVGGAAAAFGALIAKILPFLQVRP
jgi:hypothetical protein